jgi:exodeoxyribonuclease-3
MAFTLATWNINSVRLRESIVSRLMSEEMPDILCLQECKCLAEQIPTEAFEKLGYRYRVARGQKSYNGVAILSKLPMVDAGGRDFATLGHARHVAGQAGKRRDHPQFLRPGRVVIFPTARKT